MKLLKQQIKSHLLKKQNGIDYSNRIRLKNKDISLICSNCAGRIIYHWLGLKFNSPFINLYMTGEDYIKALENWKDFLNAEIVEDTNSDEAYPVGISYLGTKIHFMHYATFDEAIKKWNQRKVRINTDNIAFMYTNYAGGHSLLERFDKLPFKNKVVFTAERYPDIKSAVFLEGFKCFCKLYRICKKSGVPNIWMTQNLITGKRFIDQFDYVSWFNSISEDYKDER